MKYKSLFLILFFIFTVYSLDSFKNYLERGKQIATQNISDLKSTGSKFIDTASDYYQQLKDLLWKPIRDTVNKNNKYAKSKAEIRKGTLLNSNEIKEVKKRIIINNAQLSKILKTKLKIDQNLKIAFCASGGGYRALTATLGSLYGAKKIGLLDTVTYIAGLSGGAWTFATWVSSGKSIEEFIDLVKTNLAINKKFGDLTIPHVENGQITEIIKNLITSYVFDIPLSGADIWGATIIDNLLNPIKNRHNLKLSLQSDLIKNGKIPFPIYTAVQPLTKLKYNWFEFTPHEIGNINQQIFVPTWAFGRRFKNGISQNYNPELPLDYYLGIFGSAFTVSPEEIEDKLNLKYKVVEYLHKKFPELSLETLNKVFDFKKFFNDLEDIYLQINY